MSILHLSSLKKVTEPYVEDFIIKSQGQTFSSNYDWVSWMKKNLQFLCDDMFLIGFNKAEIKYRIYKKDIKETWDEATDEEKGRCVTRLICIFLTVITGIIVMLI